MIREYIEITADGESTECRGDDLCRDAAKVVEGALLAGADDVRLQWRADDGSEVI